MLEKKTGDYVQAGDVLAWLHTGEERLLPAAEQLFREALTWGDEKPDPMPLIYGIVR